MANIKISELNELQKATDQDLLVIVDVANNETKKIYWVDGLNQPRVINIKKSYTEDVSSTLVSSSVFDFITELPKFLLLVNF